MFRFNLYSFNYISHQDLDHYFGYKRSMRRLKKGSKSKSLQQADLDSPIQEQDLNSEQYVQQRRVQAKITKKASKRPTKSRSNLSENEDSNQSQILDIRHADETSREHVRPSFMKRWDGISNELELTYQQMNGLSPMLQVYWQVKSKNMNVIIFLQFGKMQFLAFEDDAIKLNQIFKKRLKKFSKFLMVNFWYKQVELAKQQLFERKIPVMVMNEIEDPKYRQTNKIMRRQVQEVMTPGLHLTMTDKTAFRERLLMAIYKHQKQFAVLILDSESNQFYVQEIQDGTHLHEVRRVINRYRPVEVVIPKVTHRQIGQIARQICNPYIVEFNYNAQCVQKQLQKFRSNNISLLFKQMYDLYCKEDKQNVFSMDRTVQVIGMVYRYLESLSLCEKIFNQGIFHLHNFRKSRPKPFFDSQVYENLQIFTIKNEDESSYQQPGTLIAYLDKCKTNQGKKLLHRWINEPLQNFEAIKERQEALKQIVESNPKMLALHQKLIAFEKLEKGIGDVYHWVIRNSEKGKLTLTNHMTFEKDYDQKRNPAIVRLKEIVSILNLILNYQSFLKELKPFQIQSTLLKHLTELTEVDNLHVMTLEQIGQISSIPEIGYIAASILRKFCYDPVTDCLQPAQGVNEVFDVEKQQIDRINVELIEQRDKWRKLFGNDKINYVSVRARNQLQIPKTCIKSNNKYPDLTFSSEVANAIRYTTPKTYELSEQLIEHEAIIAKTYQPFLQEIIQQFCSYRFIWDIYVQSIAQVDVLFALATVSRAMPVRCMPKFEKNQLHIRKGLHVSLLQVKQDVIPNTLHMHKEKKILILTGPNMGGKSTLLKQTCLLAIMAQMGCYVPAEEYSSIIFDQIFCRIGASDRTNQGKSTFYVELEETKRIINQATANSLIIIDELGRGTSTYDGMAIAQSVIDYILSEIQAFTLFSTHYTQITDQYLNSNQVELMKMSYEFVAEELIFGYQLVKGVAQKSFANNVAKMLGIDQSILNKADQKAHIMHKETLRKQFKGKSLKRILCSFAKQIISEKQQKENLHEQKKIKM